MAKRIVTDAKIVLRNAGYIAKESAGGKLLIVYTGDENSPGTWMEVERLAIVGGCVANGPIEILLK